MLWSCSVVGPAMSPPPSVLGVARWEGIGLPDRVRVSNLSVRAVDPHFATAAVAGVRGGCPLSIALGGMDRGSALGALPLCLPVAVRTAGHVIVAHVVSSRPRNIHQES